MQVEGDQKKKEGACVQQLRKYAYRYYGYQQVSSTRTHLSGDSIRSTKKTQRGE